MDKIKTVFFFHQGDKGRTSVIEKNKTKQKGSSCLSKILISYRHICSFSISYLVILHHSSQEEILKH